MKTKQYVKLHKTRTLLHDISVIILYNLAKSKNTLEKHKINIDTTGNALYIIYIR